MDDLTPEGHAQPLTDGHELAAVYEPIVRGGTTIAVEALLRVRRPDGALGSARHLLARPSLLPAITAFMVNQAGHATQLLDLPVHVNVPPVLISAAAHDLPPGIVLEVTEDLTDLKTLQRGILSAAEAGVEVWLDDLGTGEGAMARLAHAEGIAGVKLDGGVLGWTDSAWGTQVARGLVDLLKSFGVRIVAERIEVLGDVSVATLLGVHDMQGWYYGMPMPLEALLDVSGIEGTPREVALHHGGTS